MFQRASKRLSLQSARCIHTSRILYSQHGGVEADYQKTATYDYEIPDDAIDVVVNGATVKVPKGATVMQACEIAGVTIPRFCYHDRLSIAGNCRMCLVEVEKAKKPVASCAMPLMPGMKIKTTTNMVKKLAKASLNFYS